MQLISPVFWTGGVDIQISLPRLQTFLRGGSHWVAVQKSGPRNWKICVMCLFIKMKRKRGPQSVKRTNRSSPALTGSCSVVWVLFSQVDFLHYLLQSPSFHIIGKWFLTIHNRKDEALCCPAKKDDGSFEI